MNNKTDNFKPEYNDILFDLKVKAQSLSDVATNCIYLSNYFISTYSSEMTELQKKVVFYAISSLKNDHRNLTPDKLANTGFILKVSTFLNLVDLTNSNKYNQILCKEVEKLMKMPITYKYENGYKEIIGWFEKITYIPKHSYNKMQIESMKERENRAKIRNNNDNFIFRDQNKEPIDSDYAYIGFQFTKSMSIVLLDLINNHGYTKYNFMISHSLKNKYAIRIYELLQTRKDTNTIYMKLNDFYNSLGVGNMPSYTKNSAELKRRILNVAKTELNEKLGLGFDYRFDKKNNQITLKANKNDNDLCKEIFDTETYRIYKSKILNIDKMIDEQKNKSVVYNKFDSFI